MHERQLLKHNVAEDTLHTKLENDKIILFSFQILIFKDIWFSLTQSRAHTSHAHTHTRAHTHEVLPRQSIILLPVGPIKRIPMFRKRNSCIGEELEYSRNNLLYSWQELHSDKNFHKHVVCRPDTDDGYRQRWLWKKSGGEARTL